MAMTYETGIKGISDRHPQTAVQQMVARAVERTAYAQKVAETEPTQAFGAWYPAHAAIFGVDRYFEAHPEEVDPFNQAVIDNMRRVAASIREQAAQHAISRVDSVQPTSVG